MIPCSVIHNLPGEDIGIDDQVVFSDTSGGLTKRAGDGAAAPRFWARFARNGAKMRRVSRPAAADEPHRWVAQHEPTYH